MFRSSQTLIDRLARVSIAGIFIRTLVVAFALAGTQHFLRIVFNPPTLTDLYPVWLGSRELLIEHRNPYTAETRREIETAFYGAELGPGDHPDQQCCFAYPVYVSFLLTPALGIGFSAARIAALILLAALTALSVVCWSVLCSNAPPGRGMSGLWLTIPLVLISPPVMQGLELRQLALLVAAMLSFAALLAHSRRFVLSGVALALATIKPQMSLLPVLWMLLWCGFGWPARKGLFIGFASAMVVLVGAGEIVLRGWISDFAAQLGTYRHFAGASMLEIVYGKKIGPPLIVFFVMSLLCLMWKRRMAPHVLPTLAFILALEVPVVPGLKSLLNLVLLIPAVFLLLARYPAVAQDTTNVRETS